MPKNLCVTLKIHGNNKTVIQNTAFPKPQTELSYKGSKSIIVYLIQLNSISFSMATSMGIV